MTGRGQSSGPRQDKDGARTSRGSPGVAALRSPAPPAPEAARSKPVECPECGRDLTGTTSRTCPACGTLVRPNSPQNRIELENRIANRRQARLRRTRTAVLYVIGPAVTFLVRLLTQRLDLLPQDARNLMVGAPSILLTYHVCRITFLGIDQPLWVQWLRLGSVVVAGQAVLTLLTAAPLGCLSYFLIPGLSMCAYLFLLRRELELDMQDTAIVGVTSVTAAVLSVAGSYYVY